MFWIFTLVVAVLVAFNAFILFWSAKVKKEVESLNDKSIFIIDFLDFTNKETSLHKEYRLVLVTKMLDMIISRKELFKGELSSKMQLFILLLVKYFNSAKSDTETAAEWEFLKSPFIHKKLKRIKNIYKDPEINGLFDLYMSEIKNKQ